MKIPCMKTQRTLLILLMATLVMGSAAYALGDDPKSQGNWHQTIKMLKSPEVQNDCGRIWQLLWPWAKKGRAEASLALAELVRWKHLTPEGSGKDVLARIRLSMGLFKAAAQAGNHQAMLLVADFYNGELFGQPANQELATCWRAVARDQNRLHECQLLESTYAIIPTLDVLSVEINLLKTPNSSAQCLAPEGDTLR